MKTFIEACLAGEASAQDADTYVEAWNEEESPLSLAQYLGMTDAEYREWVQDASSLPAIIEAHRAGGEKDKTQETNTLSGRRAALEIHRVLVATTGHVTEEERNVLNANGYSRGEYGWLIYINPNEPPAVSEIETPSPGLAGALRTAKENRCLYLLLDRDAAEIEGVPTYDW